jgi:hypothetical protein
MVGEGVRIVQRKVHEPTPYSLLTLAQEGFPADEPARLVPGDGEAEAGLQRCVAAGDVVAPTTVAPLHPQRIQGVVARMTEAERCPRADDRLVNIDGQVGRDEQFPAVQLDIEDDSQDHLITPEDRIRAAMTRQ